MRRAFLAAVLFLSPLGPGCVGAQQAGASVSGRAKQALNLAALCQSEDFPCPQALSSPEPTSAPALPGQPLFQAMSFDPDSMKKLAESFHSNDPHLELLFRNAVLDTGKHASFMKDDTVYVKTGDIPAEWLRDSSAQVRPYLFVAAADPEAARFLKAVILRQQRSILKDPYANAFKEDYSVWEEKFELDSLAYPIILSWAYWQITKDKSVFALPDVAAGLAKALETMEVEQHHESSPKSAWHSWPWQVAAQLSRHPVKYTGMIWTGFRPSDDACVYNYLIPSEMMAVVALEKLEQIEKEAINDSDKARRARALADEVRQGIEHFGKVYDTKLGPTYGWMYAYEVDGLGHHLMMDDANIPSLLSSPDFGYGSTADPVYQNTRRFILSPANPYYYTGSLASGVGSPHLDTGPWKKRWVWPLSLLAQGMTATSDDEKKKVLAELLASDPGDGHLHESFDPNNQRNYTRPDFGWPNSLFAEFILTEFEKAQPLPR